MEDLAMEMLNLELAPFLGYWHPKLDQWVRDNEKRDDSEWPDNKAFRDELKQLQVKLRQYARAFGELAAVPHVERIMRTVEPDLPSG